MSILLDNCTPDDYRQLLNSWGYQASFLRQHIAPSSSDPNVLKTATQLDAVLLSVDKDFLNIKTFPPQNYQGIIVIRDKHGARQAIAAKLRDALQALYRDKLRGVLVIVEADGYSIYPSPSST
jgi:predicted nuclease of predicted toxin-antitoxin system